MYENNKYNSIMKKTLLVLLVVAMAIPAFQSCKKGDNDPLISFRSRKARLVGEWTLREGNVTETDINGTIYNTIFDGSLQTLTVNANAPIVEPYTDKVTINKDGSYKKETTDDSNIIISEGVWYFGKKNKELDIKDKETVWFTRTSYHYNNLNYNYSGTKAFNSDNIWLIGELTNKEIILILDGANTLNDKPATIKGTLTYEKK
jgi:hypothetical protein